MEFGVMLLHSENKNNDPDLDKKCKAFLDEIGREMGASLAFFDEAAFLRQGFPCFFIGSGGSESWFLSVYSKLKGPYYLLTTDNQNSLAASMEILAYLQAHGESGEILHGSPRYLAGKLRMLYTAHQAKIKISNMRMGVIGNAVERISSLESAEAVSSACGAQLIAIPMEELFQEIRLGGYPETAAVAGLKQMGYNASEMEKSLNIYGALRRLRERYRLDAMTVRCFELLKPFRSTGCLALALLNAEGIPAACEGDIKAMVSMAVLQALTGCPGFMANPSRLDPEKKEIVFAHCTLPVNMPADFHLTTHFESGLGVAIAGNIPLGKCTVFKTEADFSRYYAAAGTIEEDLHDCRLCRTQIRVCLPGGTSYLTQNPIANHQLICLGDHVELIRSFYSLFPVLTSKP